MRLLALVLLFPIVMACDAAQPTPLAAPASSSPAGGEADEAGEADKAAQRACSAYSQAPLWDARDTDTNDDGVDDFTEVFTAASSEERVRQIAEDIKVARQDPQFRNLATAFDFLASVHSRGGDRSEVNDADFGMTEACRTLGAGG